MTVEELRLRLQGWSSEAAAATGSVARPPTKISGTDVVSFGCLRGRTYAQVLRQSPQYASWVVRQLESTSRCSPALARLGRYLVANGVQVTMTDDQSEQEEIQIEIDNPDDPAEAEMEDEWLAWHQPSPREQDGESETEDSFTLFSQRRR
jgi:hypothetical protein